MTKKHSKEEIYKNAMNSFNFDYTANKFGTNNSNQDSTEIDDSELLKDLDKKLEALEVNELKPVDYFA
jgi:hypothetical protein